LADTAALTKLIEPEVESLGYRLVRVAMMGGTSDPTLQIMAEIRSKAAIASRSARPASTAR